MDTLIQYPYLTPEQRGLIIAAKIADRFSAIVFTNTAFDATNNKHRFYTAEELNCASLCVGTLVATVIGGILDVRAKLNNNAMLQAALDEADANLAAFRLGIYESAISPIKTNSEVSAVASAFQSHSARNSLWGTYKGNADLEKKALDALNEILEAPGEFQKVGIFLQKNLPDGRGVRLRMVDGQWRFDTFLDHK